MHHSRTSAFLITCSLFSLVSVLSCKHIPDDRSRLEGNVVPPQARKILDAGDRFVFLSLDPHPEFIAETSSAPSGKETFHGYPVLGKAVVHDSRQRTDLLKALYQGIAESDGEIAACFSPRHGFSATRGTNTVDLVICFECRQIRVYPGYTDRVLTTTGWPTNTFNQMLQRMGLPIYSYPQPEPNLFE